MRYTEFQNLMASFAVFSLNDARMIEPDFDRRRLHEWQTRGYIKLITKGYYIFADIDIDDARLDCIANRIYAPSYVSLETALSRAGLLPDTVRQVTSVSTRKTHTLTTKIATFSYRTIAPRLFFGYAIQDRGTRVASVEKAVLDYLYLHPDLRTQQDFESLRVDRPELSARVDQKRLEAFLDRFGGKALKERTAKFMKWVRYD